MHGPAREVAAPAADAAAGGGYGALMLTSLVVLVLVCVVAWVALRFVARWLEGRRMGGGVSVVARVPLEPRRALYVVEAGGRRLLIGSSEGGVSLVTELDAVAAPASAEAGVAANGEMVAAGGPRGPRGFAELLQLALGRRRQPRDVA